MTAQINGIQQIGIGVTNVKEAYNWYSKMFGFNILVFEDIATANLMVQYTGNIPQQRHAVLAMNMQSGGGLEIWQNTNRIAQQPNKPIQLGDTGIFAIKIKAKNIEKCYNFLMQNEVTILQAPIQNPQGNLHFYCTDLYGNIFEIVEDNHWFANTNKPTGGVVGATIGVSNMDTALPFYKNVLGYNVLLYDQIATFKDLYNLPNGKALHRRVLLKKTINSTGAFGNLLGPTQIELIQAIETIPNKIFANRYWGDAGFIHICYDVNGMEQLGINNKALGYGFTVNSINSFGMGNAAGHFCYNEDPDGTLIEYVETYKVPIAKKLGIYFNLKNRDSKKNLPNWFVKLFKFSRVDSKE